MIHPKILVLDHGYVSLVESWGSDERIIEAARMSTGKGFLGWGPNKVYDCPVHGKVSESATYEGECGGRGHTDCWQKVKPLPDEPGDEKLLRYLYENKHSTPFEMAGMAIEVMAPIEVFRQWHRHRTMSYNEMSARYTPLPDVNYVPTVERLLLNSKTNKQAGTIKGAAELTPEVAETYRELLRRQYESQEALYQWALNNGVPKELARTHIGVGRYSRMRASANLRNWLAFLTLRMDPHAQYEIRQFANAVGQIILTEFPRTWALFVEGMQ